MLIVRRTSIVEGCIRNGECLSVETQVLTPIRPGLCVVVNACSKFAHPKQLLWNRHNATPNCKTSGKESG
jgi:hypothetical protein